MNKFKTAVSRLKDYLGKDGHGIDLLNSVSAHGNDIRKSLSQIKEDLEECKQSSGRKDQQIEAANRQMKDRDEEIERIRNLLKIESRQVKRLKSELDIAKSEIERLSPEPMVAPQFNIKHHHRNSPDFAKDIKGFAEMVNALRKENRFGPRKINGNKSTETTTFHLADIITGYSYGNMAKLGMIVTTGAMLLEGVTVTAKGVRFRDTGRFKNEDGSNEELPDRVLRPFLQWFARSNIDSAPVHAKFKQTK